MIKIINYNNIVDIDIEIKEPFKSNFTSSYLDPIIGNRSIEYQDCNLINFIFFLQNNQEATNLIPLELYKEMIKAIRQEDKKIKKRFLKAPSFYVQAFFNHNNEYISSFYDCIEIIKKGTLCI